jgi:hypothetical protein
VKSRLKRNAKKHPLVVHLVVVPAEFKFLKVKVKRMNLLKKRRRMSWRRQRVSLKLLSSLREVEEVVDLIQRNVNKSIVMFV